VNVIELDSYAIEIGRARNEAAVNIYRRCRATGIWPGYATEVELVGLPRWAEIRYETELETQGDDPQW
jgi:hypothetical protein